MKTNQILKSLFIAALAVLLVPPLFAGQKTVEISLPTVQCGMCKKTIEKALNKIDGVTNADVDIENKKATVTYDDSKTNVSKIEEAISKAGYDANGRKANQKAYEKLDDCCKIK